jgi:hypothetical protein
MAASQRSAFTMAANAIPVGDEGTVRNGPARTNHQTVTPGCTKSERGALTIDGMTLGEDSNARAAALADNSTIPARSHQRFLTLFMDAA